MWTYNPEAQHPESKPLPFKSSDSLDSLSLYDTNSTSGAAPSWFEQPHTATYLGISLLCIWIVSHLFTKQEYFENNFVGGLLASCFIFIVFSTLQFPDGVLRRPWPWFWRGVKGISVLYLMLLIFLLFQNLEDCQKYLKLAIPYTSEIVEQNYAENCSSWSHFWNQFDGFVLAHFLGWFVKAIIIRDWKLLWFLSIAFEWMEISLRHILPNFWECWWDHLLLDVFGCNLLGIVLGLLCMKYFRMREYQWRSRKQLISKPAFSRHFCQFLPQHLTNYRWSKFLWNWQTFICLTVLSALVTLLDLNVFFLKAEMGLRSDNALVILRMFFWAFASASGVPEFYKYISNGSGDRMGVQCWLCLAMLSGECLLILKWWKGLPKYDLCPTWIKIVWLLIAIIYIFILICLFVYSRDTEGDHDREKQKNM